MKIVILKPDKYRHIPMDILILTLHSEPYNYLNSYFHFPLHKNMRFTKSCLHRN